MGKAARLNRERREKATRDDPDWDIIRINIYAKESAYLRVKSAFVSKGLFSDEEVIMGINGQFFKDGMYVAHDHLGWTLSIDTMPVRICVYIYSDNARFWREGEQWSGGFIQVRFRGKKGQSSFYTNESEPDIKELKHSINFPIKSASIFYFPDDAGDRLIGSALLKTEWTLRDFLVEGKKSYGHGILFYESNVKTLVYMPITKSDVIGMNSSLDNFESNYYLLSSTDLFVFQADENGLLDYHKDFLNTVIAKSPDRTIVSCAFKDTITVAQGQIFDDYRKGIFRLFRESIWHHKERL